MDWTLEELRSRLAAYLARAEFTAELPDKVDEVLNAVEDALRVSVLQSAKDVYHQLLGTCEVDIPTSGFVLQAALREKLHRQIDMICVEVTSLPNPDDVLVLYSAKGLGFSEEVVLVGDLARRDDLHRALDL